VDNGKDVYLMTNLLKWLDEVAPADQRRLVVLSSVGLLNALQTVSGRRSGDLSVFTPTCLLFIPASVHNRSVHTSLR